MNTSTEKKPTFSVPLITMLPPISSVVVKPQRMAMRISGTNAEERRIAFALASA